jgi:hypothetical protein
MLKCLLDGKEICSEIPCLASLVPMYTTYRMMMQGIQFVRLIIYSITCTTATISNC